jgi:hypothetical protein
MIMRAALLAEHCGSVNYGSINNTLSLALTNARTGAPSAGISCTPDRLPWIALGTSRQVDRSLVALLKLAEPHTATKLAMSATGKLGGAVI